MSGAKDVRSLTALSRRLRRTETIPERILWSRLRGRAMGPKFRRQFPIDDYVVDFICLKSQLVVELDGDTHAGDEAETEDRLRSVRIASHGLRVIRFTNREVIHNLDGVLEAIRMALSSPSPPPSPSGRGG